MNSSTNKVHQLRDVSQCSLFAHPWVFVHLLSTREKHRLETMKLSCSASGKVLETTPLPSVADTKGSKPKRGQECVRDERDKRSVVQTLERHSKISLSPISHDPTKVNGVQFAQPFWRKAGVMRRSLKTLMTLMPERLGTSLSVKCLRRAALSSALAKGLLC